MPGPNADPNSCLSFKTVPQCDNIIIIGAGPSTKVNIDKIAEYQKNSPSSIVITANYQYSPVKSDYIVFVDQKIYKQEQKKIHSYKNDPYIVTSRDTYWRNYKIPSKILPIYHRGGPSFLKTKQIEIREDGFINHQVGNAGWISILISYFFKPQRILICGFDGPSKKISKHIVKYNHWNEKRVANLKIIKPSGNKKFLYKLFSFLSKNNISILSFKNDRLWGINKERALIINYL